MYPEHASHPLPAFETEAARGRKLLAVLLTSAIVSITAAAGEGPADRPATPPVAAAPAKAAASADETSPYPGCKKIFNGVNFDGWTADPSTWSIVDGAMRGVAGPRGSPTRMPTTAASASSSPHG
jgi:hypothetical protein